MDFFTSLWQFLYNFFDYPMVQGLVSGLLATIVGVALGIPAALRINRVIESQTASEKVSKIIHLLKDELEYNEIELSRLDGNLPQVVHEAGSISASLRIELWKAYSDGGELQWVKDLELVAMLADTYYSIRAVMTLTDKAYEFVQHGQPGHALPQSVEDNLMTVIGYANRSVKKSIKKIDHTLKTKSRFQRFREGLKILQ
jgi:hypothetical protein